MPLTAVFLALASALFHSSSVVTLRPLFRGKATPEAASFFTLLVGSCATGSVLVGMMVAATPSESINTQAVAYFILSGIVGAGIARMANYHSVRLVGATRGNLLVNSSPLFVLPLAALFLSEEITTSKLIGALLIFAAILTLSMESEAKSDKGQVGRFARRGFAFGILAAILYTFARLFRKVGIDYAYAPVSASFVSSATALLMISSASVASSDFKGRVKVDKSAVKMLVMAGLLQAMGQVLEFASYGTGDASLVVPIRGTTPIMTAGLSYLFIRRYERMTKYLFLAVLVGVLGIVILGLGS
jgi:drug/metabolite transporter (DMT)-like permease